VERRLNATSERADPPVHPKSGPIDGADLAAILGNWGVLVF
jgi:hypothetical protein